MIEILPNDDDADLRPRLKVVGVGGAGGNAINNMIRANLEGVEFMAVNTDAQALRSSQADIKLQLGHDITRGLGAGSKPDTGRDAARESLDELASHLAQTHMVFITAGMGGGTGTGAAPIIAEAAREAGVLTVGVVTKPFHFEGAHRMRIAEAGIDELQKHVDTLIIIPNQNLFRIANEKTTFADAFRLADEVLHSGVRGVTDLMTMPGLINLDFADIRAVMSQMGKAMMGTGEAEGERRCLDAAEKAISNPLLEDISMRGARGVLINITGGPDMTLFEVDEAANRIREEVDPEANIIFGSTFDETIEGRVRVSVVATGIDSGAGEDAPAGPHLAVVGGREPRRSGEAAGTATAADQQSREAPAASQEPGTEMPAATGTDAASAASAGAEPAGDGPQLHPAQRLGRAPEGGGEQARPVGRAGGSPLSGQGLAIGPTGSHQAGAGGTSGGDAFIAPQAKDRGDFQAEDYMAEIVDSPATRSGGTGDAQGGPSRGGKAPGGGARDGKRKAPSLFEMVTGMGRQREEGGAAEGHTPRREAGTERPSQAAPTSGGGAETAGQTQGELGGVTGQQRPSRASQSNQDDLLDIPAFLRRQAN